jgi:hypothetical protein
MTGRMDAQQAPRQQAAQQAPAVDSRLPVRRVVLYKSGIGYFEHLGEVQGSQNVTIEFTSGQLNDVLKSLTTLDLDGGRIVNVSYNSEASLDRRLGALRLPVGEQTTRAQFLTALRGARIEVRSGGAAARVAGRLLSVEQVTRQTPAGAVQGEALSLVTDAGDLHTVALDPGVTVRIAENDLNEEVGRYLSLVASVRDQDVRRLTISTAGTGARDLFVSYVSEVPVWKSTYRLVMPQPGDTRAPLLQGWAVVDNTVGEDWEQVELSLVAGAPQSFIQQISQPYYVQRPIVPLPERALLAPQTHQAGLGTAGQGALTGLVSDTSGGVLPAVRIQVMRAGVLAAAGSTGADGRYRIDRIAPGSYDVMFTLQGFRGVRHAVTVAGGMENVLNTSLEVGALSEKMTVSNEPPVAAPAAPPPPAMAGRSVSGRGGGAPFDRLEAVAERVDAAQNAFQAQAAGADLGDLFEYKLKEPVTIRRNQSALVPIVGAPVQVEKVSLWNPSSPQGRPLHAMWLTNTTGLTLDGGSFTIVEGQAFAGEGLVEPLKAGEKRLLSYAVDLGMHVSAKSDSRPSRITRVQMARGVLIQHSELRQQWTYTARNEDDTPRTLVVEHSAQQGWTLGGDVKPAESTAAWHRFRQTVAPKTTVTFSIDETRPLQSQFRLTDVTDPQIAVWVKDSLIDAATEARLRDIMARQAVVVRIAREMAAREAETKTIAADQARVRENMRALKGSSEERDLLQRYVRQLTAQEDQLELLRGEIEKLRAGHAAAQAELAKVIEG